MDAKVIEGIIKVSPLARKDEKAFSEIRSAIYVVYVQTGSYRNIEKSALDDEIDLYTSMLINDLNDDRKLKTIHTSEIGYCFNNGIKGRLSTDKDMIVSYKTLVRWLDAYVDHSERRIAFTNSSRISEAKRIEQRTSPEERRISMEKMINEAYQDYEKFYSAPKVKITGRIKMIGEVMSDTLPFSVKDYGGIKRAYLASTNKIKNEKNLVEYFDKCIAEKVKTIF
ncbi:MAG: hypothetical protein A2X18_07520 [Bacteroidetes bacterium GWF2_40_14]|nr:MAG: hypothetical protein A2X18_07520 [Bacteroidetes bacterium GWF2_40_14]